MLNTPARGALRVDDNAESGAVLVFTMIALTVLLAMSALVIDLGFGYVIDRRAAAAADHASLAAAFASCEGDNVSTAANTAAVNNGFTTSELTLTEVAPDTFKAVISTQVGTFFGAVIGFDNMTVSAAAVATCSVSAGGTYAIFAGGNSCGGFGKDELDISGSNQEIFGGVHSNGEIDLSGSNNDFGVGHAPVDPVTYVNTFNHGGSGNTFDSGYPDKVSPIGTWPVEFDRLHYRALAQNGHPDHHYVTGDIDGSFIAANGDGLYYATGKIQLDKTVDLDVTLVAEDHVDVSASDQVLDPYMDDLLMFGAVEYTGVERCDKQGVKLAGSNNNWNGTIYAPLSQVEFSGSTNTSLNGSIVAWSVNLNGSTVSVTADTSAAAGFPDVSLLE